MAHIPVSDLYPGMVLAEDIYAHGTSRLLLPSGTSLTAKNIARLAFYSIYSVNIVQQEAPASKPAPKPETFSERIRNSAEFMEFHQNYSNSIDSFKKALGNTINMNKPLDADALFEDTLSLMRSGSGKVNLFDMLTNLRNHDDATYVHNINVALICNIFAGWLHFSEEETQIATLCGLFHDIGKMMVPDHILKKEGALTDSEYEIVKSHAIKGYQKLKDMNMDSRIYNAALMHHERCDGSGYPLGLEGEQISPYASLVGIADVYDAMTSARAYREPVCPFDVISLLESEGYQKYAPKYLMTFLENIVNSYLLNTVRLSDGREGTIVYINKDKFSCPTIQVGVEYVDLFKQTDLTIEKIL